MASQCIVENCSFKPNAGTIGERPSLHRFPWKNPRLARKWVSNISKSGTPSGKITHSSRVCSLHFENGIRTLESVPSIFNLTRVCKESTSLKTKSSDSREGKNKVSSASRSPQSPRKRSTPKHCMAITNSESLDNEANVQTVQLQKKVEKAGFQEHFLAQVSHFWRTRQFCDLCLIVNDNRVLCHQLVFNIARPFCLSTCPVTRHAPMLTITVPFPVSDDTITNFLSYLYEGSLFISEQSVHQILQLGQFFRMTQVTNSCNSFIELLRTMTICQPADNKSMVSHKGDKESQGPKSGDKHPAVSRKWRSIPKTQSSKPGDVKTESYDTKVCVTPVFQECSPDDGFGEHGEQGEQGEAGTHYVSETLDHSSHDKDVDGETSGDHTDETTDQDIEERTVNDDETVAEEVDERTFEDLDERTFEGVDETPFYEEGFEDEAERNSQPHVVSVSWSDDEDQEWVVLPNKNEDNAYELEGDDIDKSETGQETPEPKETFLEAFSLSRDEFEQIVSSGVDSHEGSQDTECSGAEMDGTNGLTCEAEDVKPLLLPDGTAVDRRGTSAASGWEFDAIANAQMPHYDESTSAEDVKPVLLPDGTVRLPDIDAESGDVEHSITSASASATPVLMFGNGTKSTTSMPETEMFEHENISFRYYKCDQCTSLFTSQARQQEHVQVVHHGVRYKCQYCGREFTSRSGHKLHELDHLGKNPYKKYKCEKCFKTFHTKTGLNNHLTRLCLQFKCGKCKAVFVNSKDHRHHVSNCRRMLAHIKCPECHQVFSSKFNLARHSKIHQSHPVSAPSSKPVRKFQCHVCLKVILGKARFLQHKVEHVNHLKQALCSACSQTFKTISAMRRHFKTDHPDLELPTSAKISWRDLRRESPFLEDNVDDEQIQEVQPDENYKELESTPVEVTPEQKRKWKKCGSVQGEVIPQDHKSNSGNTREFSELKSDVIPETTLPGGRSRFLCVQCGQSFPFAASLRRHSKSEHPLK